MIKDYQLKFKHHYLGTVFQITKATWLKISLAYILVMLVTAFMVGLTVWSFWASLESPLVQNNGNVLKTTIPFTSFSLFSSIISSIGLMIFFALVSIFLSAWHYNFSFIAVNSKIKSNNLTFVEIFKSSFNSGIFKIILMYVFFIIFAFLFFGIAIFSMWVYNWLIVIISLLAIYFVFKLILTLPAFVIGKKSLYESFYYSFTNITSIRVFKLFAASIAFFILLTFIQLIIYSTSLLISFVPIIGYVSKLITLIIQITILIAFSGLIIAFTVSAVTGLYYRYDKDVDLIETDELEYLGNNEKIELNDENEPPNEMINNLFA